MTRRGRPSARRARPKALSGGGAEEKLIADLRLHQVELEMQNRELREARAALEESHARYAELYDFAPVGYCTFDPEGYVQEINLTGATLLGAARGDLIGRSLNAVGAATERGALLAHLRACASSGGKVVGELTLQQPGREARVVQLVSAPVRDADGATLAVRSALIDVTERKQAERGLRLLSEAGQVLQASLDPKELLAGLCRLLVPALGDVCFADLVGENGRLERLAVAVKDPARQLVLGERLRQPEHWPGWYSPQAHVVETGEPMLLNQLPRAAAAPALLTVGAMLVLPLVARGRAFGALTLVREEPGQPYLDADLQFALTLAGRVALATDNARLHAQAKEAVAARDDLLAMVSHDLRNPLSAILMKTSLLLKGPAGVDRRTESRSYVEFVRRAAEKMNRLIGDLLDERNLARGHLTIEPSRHRVAPLLKDAVEAFGPLAAQRSIRLVEEAPREAGLSVYCDRMRLEQVFANLIGNALKFSPAGGTIWVKAARREAEVCFSVRDDGPGIAPDDLPRVFDTYWQARPGSKAGSGLGLAITRGIVEAHGGRIWVESRPKAGSTFFFSLPLAHASTRSVSNGRVVLVAEDDPEVRGVVAETVRHAGGRPVEVSNGAEALAYLRNAASPALVILDLAMPVLDGWGFLEERGRDARLKQIPVIVVSGQPQVADRVTAAEAAFMRKPVHPDELIDAVSRVLR